MEPMTLDLAGAIAALTSVGVLPVITLGALVFIASKVYKSFRR